MLLYKYDPVIKAESTEESEIGCMEVLEGEGSSCEHNNMKSYTIKVVQMPVAQHYLMMEDGGDST